MRVAVVGVAAAAAFVEIFPVIAFAVAFDVVVGSEHFVFVVDVASVAVEIDCADCSMYVRKHCSGEIELNFPYYSEHVTKHHAFAELHVSLLEYELEMWASKGDFSLVMENLQVEEIRSVKKNRYLFL